MYTNIIIIIIDIHTLNEDRNKMKIVCTNLFRFFAVSMLQPMSSIFSSNAHAIVFIWLKEKYLYISSKHLGIVEHLKDSRFFFFALFVDMRVVRPTKDFFRRHYEQEFLRRGWRNTGRFCQKNCEAVLFSAG